MGKARYQCKSCLNQMTIEVPMSENATRFADKVPCTKCGKIGCSWRGSA